MTNDTQEKLIAAIAGGLAAIAKSLYSLFILRVSIGHFDIEILELLSLLIKGGVGALGGLCIKWTWDKFKKKKLN